MSMPIICLDECLCQFCEVFRACFSKPQFKYLVTVLLALIICQESRTLSGLMRQIAGGPSVSGLSRFLSEAPWSAVEVAGRWYARFVAQMIPAVQAEHARQRAVCEREGVPFQSKIDLMEQVIRTFEPVIGTLTHVLLDAWYGEKRLWRAARERGFHITTGVKGNRSLRIKDPQARSGWRCQRLSDYAAALSPEQHQKVVWPAQDPDEPREVYVHVVTTRIRKLYKCQVIIARPSLDCPPQAVRYWASSDLDANLLTLGAHIATRWTIEVFFGETKDLLGLDQYQVMSATALLRFWTLVCLAYVFLEEQNALLRIAWQRHVTLGETRRVVQQRHWGHLVNWLHDQFSLGVTPEELQSLLVA